MVMTYQVDSEGRPGGQTRGENWEFRLAFAATFVLMLVTSVCSRLSLSHWGGTGSVHQSIFEEAASRTDKVIPFMFMG
jgi:hypothetical protein